MSDVLKELEKMWTDHDYVRRPFEVHHQTYKHMEKVCGEWFEEKNGNEIYDLSLDMALQPKLDKDTGWWYLKDTKGMKIRVLSWDGEGNYRAVCDNPKYEKEFKSKWRRVSDLVPCLVPRKN